MLRIKKLKIHLSLAILLLMVLLVSGVFIFSPISFRQIAQAVTGNYAKNTGDDLTSADWNNLPNDFLDKQSSAGDSMAGPLTLPSNPTSNMQAATKQYTDGKVVLQSGGIPKIFCGSTVTGATAWAQYNPESIRVLTVDTSAAGFTSTPHYFTNLSGSYTYVTGGGSAVYNATATGFRFYAYYFGENLDNLTDFGVTITPAQANSWGWTIHWCGVGY